MFKNVAFIGLWLTILFSSFISRAQNIDPTKPLSGAGFSTTSKAEKTATAELVLESIIHGYEVHTADINGQVLKVGDFIRQYKLIAVNNSSVVLRSADKRLKLSVFSGVVVKSK